MALRHLIIIALVIAGIFIVAPKDTQADKIVDTYPYAWAQAPQDSFLDDWGMSNRECTSYVAYKIYKTYGYEPIRGANAFDWPMVAQSLHLTVTTTPKVHSAAVDMIDGEPGHVMWVEKVLDGGKKIRVSDYNGLKGGGFGVEDITLRGSGITFIYF